MSYPNQQHYHQSDEYSSYSRGGGAPMGYSARSSQGGYSQQNGNALDFSDRSPSSQGAYSRGVYSQGVYSHGGYTQGGYTQGEYTAGEHTGIYTEGGHTRGASSQNGYTSNNSEGSRRSGYSGAGYESMWNSERTPHSGYAGAGGASAYHSERTPHSGYTQGGYEAMNMNNSARTPYSSGVYTERGGASNHPGGNSYYEGGGMSYHPHQLGASDHSVGSGVGGARRRLSNSSMSQLSISHEQTDGRSQASTGGTTVANGGRGRCPYQVEFRVQNQGKQMSSSKRVIAFRYGFANERALSMGKTGVDCRGEEHDIVVTWSITGGKRAISMDGRQIQYAAGKRANPARRADILEASWRMSDHVYELRCHAYRPAVASPEKRNPRWNQYSLIIDGREFSALPQIFDLGMKGLRPSMPVAPSQVDRQTNSLTSSLTISHASNEPPPAQVKETIKSRIDQQRKLMKERKQALANEKNKLLPGHVKAKTEELLSYELKSSDLEATGVESTGIASTGFESSGVESVGVESTGVQSPAPSELGEAMNRQETAPAPVPLPALTSSQPDSTQEKQLTHCAGRQVSRPSPKMTGENSGRQKPQQHQIQAKPSPDIRRSHHPLKNYQIRDRQSVNSGSCLTSSATSGATSVGTNHPPLTQQSSTHGHQGIAFAPQEPPTYDEITRDILGAYDDGSAATSSGEKSAMVPRTGGKFSDTGSSNAGESSIVPRVGRASVASAESSVVPSSAGESSLVPVVPNGFDLSDRTGGTSISNLGDSVVSRDSNLVSARANQKPPAPGPPQRPQSKIHSGLSSVDTRGVNKWGYF